MKVVAFEPHHASQWDAFVQGVRGATFMQSRCFLDYHKARFREASLMVMDEAENIVAVLPAAAVRERPEVVVSHPGATYGGIVCEERTPPERVSAALQTCLQHWALCGFSRLIYKPIPPHLVPVSTQVDVYCLWRSEATMARVDLWNVFDLTEPFKLPKGHKWSMARARKHGLTLHRSRSSEDYSCFFAMLGESLRAHHQQSPVHNEAELMELQNRLPENIELFGAHTEEGELCAGAWLFKYPGAAWHTQYIAANSLGRDLGATVFLLQAAMDAARQNGVRWFSFGASNEGRAINEGLFQFKQGFGAGSFAHTHYELDLTRSPL